MESWQKAWRNIQVSFTATDLETLLTALTQDDKRIVQGATIIPTPWNTTEHLPVEACDAISFVGWQRGLNTVKEVEKFYTEVTSHCNFMMNEVAGSRHFINWYDDGNRQYVFGLLIEEIKFNLAKRYGVKNYEAKPSKS